MTQGNTQPIDVTETANALRQHKAEKAYNDMLTHEFARTAAKHTPGTNPVVFQQRATVETLAEALTAESEVGE